jgi:hypothetical protein
VRRVSPRAAHPLPGERAPPIFAGALVTFELAAAPEIDGEVLRDDPRQPESGAASASDRLAIVADPILAGPFTRGRADLRSLAVPQADQPPYVVAGVP